jgi:hypothetical protein
MGVADDSATPFSFGLRATLPQKSHGAYLSNLAFLKNE